MDSKTRKRPPIVKPKKGFLTASWGRTRRDDNPDLCYTWGEDCSKADSYLLHYILCSGAFDPNSQKLEPSLKEELERRGYDITTLKFSIQKKFLGISQPSG